MSLGERLTRIRSLSAEAFRAEAFADHIVRVAVARDADGDVFTADALRVMARVYRVRALDIWTDLASIGSADAIAQHNDA